MDCALFRLVVVALLAFHLRRAQCKVVECYDQKEVCDCPRGEPVCEFKLEIEELQTFTSYVVKDRDLLSRGTPGDTYWLNETGFHPAVPNEDVPERGECYLNSSFQLVYDRDFTEQSCSVPMTVDGVSYRLFIAVNGRIPGPTLIMDDGALVKVEVVNRLTSESVTIHWHGMHQKDTPWMDGVGFISQSPIEPGASFDYIFKATPAGTHWYHSHVGAQRTDGLFGALVVREEGDFFHRVVTPKIISSPAEPYQIIYDVPESHTLTLLDWQRESSLNLFVRIHSTLGFYGRNVMGPSHPIGRVPTTRDKLYNPRTVGPDGIEVGPVPYWSGLINGRGSFNGILTPLSVFTVTRDSVNRFRLIGAQSLYAYSFSIDSHQLRVIATDGHFITPVTVDYIVVHSGERYDFLVETFNQQETMFYIRAETLETPVIREHTSLAVLSYGNTLEHDVDWRSGYSGIPNTPRSCSQDSPCLVLNCPFLNYSASLNKACVPLASLTALFPLPEDQLPKFENITDDGCGDCLRFFNFGFEGESSTSAINGKNFQLPVVPYQTNCGQYDADYNTNTTDTCNKCDTGDSEDCKCTHVVRIVQKQTFAPDKEEPRTVVMVFSAVGLGDLRDFAHPIHLHGHSFHVLHIGHGDYVDGKLTNNSADVTCGDDRLCKFPTWGQGVELSDIIAGATGSGGRIRSDLIRKDTVMVPAGGYVVVAFRADNPGYWFLHCHIEVHQLEGMGVLIEEYPYTQHRRPPAGINQHGSFRWTLGEFTEFVSEGATCGGSGGSKASLLVVTMAAALLLYLL